MTSSMLNGQVQALRRAAVRATLAPSVHNTQPWRFVIGKGVLEIHADWTRKLHVVDPTGRQLLISCGCALFNARVALAAAGYDGTTDRSPDPIEPGPIALVSLPNQPAERVSLGRLDAVIEQRQSNRRRFTDEPTPRDVLDALGAAAAAAAEDAQLIEIGRPEHRSAAARLSQEADQQESANPAYRAELRAWTTADPSRRDGVAAMAVPHADGGSGDDIPIRDFDTHGLGWLPTMTQSSMNQCLLLLGTLQDQPAAWLRAGEALERVLLEAALRGFVASLFTQVVEVPRIRQLLRAELDAAINPHVLLRVGRAPKTPASRRRPLADVITESG
jgi:nitroreductase